ncbi:hypothetical protein MANES_17G022250v8 [Manihot esculenta]|uniref:Uncharacterized protein n=1 Tax=Manihot esculenta TaxID=3983 RepID=A0ACB7G258_MANES|nr:hypothetical protein MANES_17G022250v8 [Manihot esculenta]
MYFLFYSILFDNLKMPRGGSDKPSQDIGWNFATPTGKKGEMTCNFCGKKITGGITRLKQHLANIPGQVAGCQKVSAQVKKDMGNMLRGFEAAKRDKAKRARELEDEIMKMTEVEGSDSDEEDIELEIARRESMRQFDEDAYRRRASHYESGESSHQAPPHSGISRSATVRERGREASRFVEQTSTPASRLAATEIQIEKNRSLKQTKIKTKWLKSQKEKLLKAFDNFVIHNRLPFSAVESPWTKPLLKTAAEVGPNVSPPSAYEISEIYLKNEYKEMKKYIASFEGMWNERGVTIMCDGWSGPTRMSIINFLVYSPRGTVFHKFIDASNVKRKNGEYYFKIMKEVVEEIGPSKIVQVVTDNEAAIKSGGKKLMEKFPNLYWTACSAHCIDLILEEFGKRKNIKTVIEQGKVITQFIYNHNWVVNYMKKFTNGQDIIHPGITRFATNFIALESLLRCRTGLRNMFESEQWVGSKYGQAISGPAYEAKKIVLSLDREGRNFWEKAEQIMKIQEPLLKVLRLVDGDEKPTMGFIYEAMERAKLVIKQNSRSYIDYWKIIDTRWNFQLHHDLHAAGKKHINLILNT